MSDSKKPVSKVSLYPVNAAIWRNHGSLGAAFYSVTFDRSYKDSDGKWQQSDSFTINDLLLLAKVADHAHSEIYKLQAQDRKVQQSDE